MKQPLLVELTLCVPWTSRVLEASFGGISLWNEWPLTWRESLYSFGTYQGITKLRVLGFLFKVRHNG